MKMKMRESYSLSWGLTISKLFLCQHRASHRKQKRIYVSSLRWRIRRKCKAPSSSHARWMRENESGQREIGMRCQFMPSIIYIHWIWQIFAYAQWKKGRRTATMRNCHKYVVFIPFYSFDSILCAIFYSFLFFCLHFSWLYPAPIWESFASAHKKISNSWDSAFNWNLCGNNVALHTAIKMTMKNSVGHKERRVVDDGDVNAGTHRSHRIWI